MILEFGKLYLFPSVKREVTDTCQSTLKSICNEVELQTTNNKSLGNYLPLVPQLSRNAPMLFMEKKKKANQSLRENLGLTSNTKATIKTHQQPHSLSKNI